MCRQKGACMTEQVPLMPRARVCDLSGIQTKITVVGGQLTHAVVDKGRKYWRKTKSSL